MKSKRIQKVLAGKLAFLRNAKEFNMDISTDSQGQNIIRRTATGKNIRKAVNDSKDYTLTFNAEDQGSGFDRFVLLTWDMLSQELQIYVDENGNSYFYGEDHKMGTEQYSKDIKLPFDSGAVIVVPFDKVNNMGESDMVTFVQSNLIITNPENGLLFDFDENITLEYGFETNIYDSVLDHYEISIDDNEAVDNGKETTYDAGILPAGYHNIKVVAFDNQSEVLDSSLTTLVVQSSPFNCIGKWS